MTKTIEDLDAFQLARKLVKFVYMATASFPEAELFGLTAQLRRAAVSVMSDIAEGQGRLTYGEWRQMLGHARGSLYEVEAQVLVAGDLGYLDEKQITFLRKKVKMTAGKLTGLIRWVQSQEKQPPRGRQPATGNRQPVSEEVPSQQGS